jgi:hypothetical protein
MAKQNPAPQVLLRSWVGEVAAGILQLAGMGEFYGIAERTGGIPDLLLEGMVFIQCIMRRSIRFHVTDIAVSFGETAGRNQRHVGEPIRKRAA